MTSEPSSETTMARGFPRATRVPFAEITNDNRSWSPTTSRAQSSIPAPLPKRDLAPEYAPGSPCNTATLPVANERASSPIAPNFAGAMPPSSSHPLPERPAPSERSAPSPSVGDPVTAASCRNIVVVGQPRSGKTEGLLAIARAEANAGHKVLLLVSDCTSLHDIRRDAPKPERYYHRILIDDFHNWTKHDYQVLINFLAKHEVAPFLAVAGDSFQLTAGSPGDLRFLQYADRIFAFICPYRFETFRLGPSQMLHQTVRFITRMYPNLEKLDGCHDGRKPWVLDIADNSFIAAAADHLLPEIKQHLDSCLITAPNFRPSGAGNLCLLFRNALTARGIPLSFPGDRNPHNRRGKLDVLPYDDLIGQHWNLVIVFGLEGGHHSIPTVLTRAIDLLVIIRMLGKSPPSDLGDCAEVTPFPSDVPSFKSPTLDPRHIAVTGLTEDLSDAALAQALTHLSITELTPPLPESAHIIPRTSIITDRAQGHSEPVGDINGLMVTVALAGYLEGQCTQGQCSLDVIRSLVRGEIERQGKYKGDHRVVAFGAALKRNPCVYDWMVPFIPRIIERLAHRFSRGENVRVEFPLAKYELGGQSLVGWADAITPGEDIYEFKFVNALQPKHQIQAIMYAFLFAMGKGSSVLPRTRLWNLRDNNMQEITSTVQGVETMIHELLRTKNGPPERVSDAEFLKFCEDTRIAAKCRNPGAFSNVQPQY
ncbi:hypothetical protein K438DRAFT_2168407 [Mycena galopus ATCC 62051]|nr:hypothetical protein K438DRAFT_2168407 [Mycena galopus ATCC 62051]